MTYRLALITGLIFFGLLIWGTILWRGQGPMGPPADRPVYLQHQADTLRLTVVGTSLSSPPYNWPKLLQADLQACLGRQVTLTRITQSGANIAWAKDVMDQIMSSDPDLVIMEFDINNADVRDGLSVVKSEEYLGQIVTNLQNREEQTAIVLMTMNPTHGLRGVLRPRLSTYYERTRQFAATRNLGLADFEPRWRALRHSERAMEDGLHPDPTLADQMIAPVLQDLICA